MLRPTKLRASLETFSKPVAKLTTVIDDYWDGPCGHHGLVFSIDRPPLLAVRRREARALVKPTSTAARRLDCSDVDLFHLHHRIERALGCSAIGIGDRFRQGDRRNLPR